MLDLCFYRLLHRGNPVLPLESQNAYGHGYVAPCPTEQELLRDFFTSLSVGRRAPIPMVSYGDMVPLTTWCSNQNNPIPHLHMKQPLQKPHSIPFKIEDVSPRNHGKNIAYRYLQIFWTTSGDDSVLRSAQAINLVWLHHLCLDKHQMMGVPPNGWFIRENHGKSY